MPDMAVTIRTTQGEALNPASTGAQIALTAQNGVEKANVQEELEAVHARIDGIDLDRDAVRHVQDMLARVAASARIAVTLAEGAAEGALLPLPDGFGYWLGHHAVSLLWDGVVCHEGENFEEVGEPGTASRALRLLFDVPPGSRLQIDIAGHVDAPQAGEANVILNERLDRIEENLSALDAAAVRYAADAGA